MAAGRRPKTSRIAAVSRSTGTVSVPNVSTYIPTGCEVPIAYAMRWVAKNVVAAGLARRCEVQVAYAIGTSHPVGMYVETFGTETVPVDRLTAAIREVFDLRPAAIVRDLDQVFDYAVPASMAASARAGVRVRVRLGRQDVDGFCVGRLPASAHDLIPLRRVVSDEVVLTPEVLELARAVARRWVGTLPDVLRLAVPPRHARVEADGAGHPADAVATGLAAPEPPAEAPLWADYRGGPAFLRRLAEGQAPRAVWQALPGPTGHTWADGVAEAVGVAVAAGGTPVRPGSRPT